jgi:Fe-S-cluster containining protein
MGKNSSIADVNDDSLYDSPVFNLTDSSRILLASIEHLLDELIARAELIPSDDEFYYKFTKVLDIYEQLQHEVLADSGISTVCSAGCSTCCFHWVEDVNSFEAAILARYLEDNYPGIIEQFICSFRKDAEVLESLRAIVDDKITEFSSYADEIADPYELLLSCFYQLERPCALLDSSGCCIVYPVRPLTCRDYLNLCDPEICHPDRINEEEQATLVMLLSEAVSQKIEILHRRFDISDNDMSLRTLLPRYLG